MRARIRLLRAGMRAGVKQFVAVNLRQLSASGKFQAGEDVTLELLRQRNLLNLSGREATLPLKVGGELSCQAMPLRWGPAEDPLPQSGREGVCACWTDAESSTACL